MMTVRWHTFVIIDNSFLASSSDAVPCVKNANWEYFAETSGNYLRFSFQIWTMCMVESSRRVISIRMTVGHIVSVKISQCFGNVFTSHVFDNGWYRHGAKLCHGPLPQGRRRWRRCIWKRIIRCWGCAGAWRIITRFFERFLRPR